MCQSKAAFFRFLNRPFYSEFFQLVEFLKTKKNRGTRGIKEKFPIKLVKYLRRIRVNRAV
jgi:hypothetical protein